MPRFLLHTSVTVSGKSEWIDKMVILADTVEQAVEQAASDAEAVLQGTSGHSRLIDEFGRTIWTSGETRRIRLATEPAPTLSPPWAS